MFISSEVSLGNHFRLERLVQGTLENVILNDELHFHVGGLVITCNVLIAKLLRTFIISDHEALALHVDPLAELVVIVQPREAEFQLDAGGLILDVETLVEIARGVGSGDLALDDQIIGYLDRPVLVHCLELPDGYGSLGGEIRISVDSLVCRLVIFPGEYRTELVTCAECRCGNDDCYWLEYVLHNLLHVLESEIKVQHVVGSDHVEIL